MSAPYDEPLFRELVEAWKRGEIVEAPPPGTLEPLRPGDVTPLPARGTAEHARLAALGEGLLREGKVAALVVAGGAGTRFGGAVKALVPVVDGKTFIDLKLLDIERTSERLRRPIPV
ncbi:MAG TPA: UTP--glucose-1-phosphate uridylyltransferase, partial [Myxococcaceae bacterium]